MHDSFQNFVSLHDGTCDQTKELETLTGIMSNDDKWVISSSGHHMFASFNVDDLVSYPGFTARIHYGNEINDIKNCTSKKKHRFIFQSIVEL